MLYFRYEVYFLFLDEMDGEINNMNRTQDLSKLIRLTGDRAKLDAKANGTYIVYCRVTRT